MEPLFLSHPGCYYIYNRLRIRKHPPSESAPRMVKVAQVTAVGNTQQRTFPARIESGDSTELSFKRGGQVESLDIRQGKRRPGANAGAPECPRGPATGQ